MKKLLLFPVVTLFLFSCTREQISFIDKYHPIIGTWALESVSYDSAGINITHSSPFDKLVINDNFAYSIYLDQVHRIENGIINIVTQTNNKLELFFDAENPIYSSHIGSHVFGLSNVELISLSDNELIFRTINAEYGIYSDRTITCKK